MSIKGITVGQPSEHPSLRSDHLTRFTVAPETRKYRGAPKEGFVWLQMDDTYPQQIQTRLQLLERHGDVLIDRLTADDLAAKNIQTTPEKIRAAEEEMRDAVVAALLKDHPDYFFVQNDCEIHSPVTGVTVDLKQAEPLVACAALASEDILLMMPCETDERGLTIYRLGAGALLFPNEWSLRSLYTGNDEQEKEESLQFSKLGKSTREIHQKVVKHYMKHFTDQVDKGFHSLPANSLPANFLSSNSSPANPLPTNSLPSNSLPSSPPPANPVSRCPYAAQLGLQGNDPAGDARDAGMNRMKEGMFLLRSGWSPQLTNRLMMHADIAPPPKMTVTTEFWENQGFIRMEHQTLSKLPKSGAIPFTIKTYNWNMMDVMNNDIARQALIVGNDNLSDDMVEYRQKTVPSFRLMLDKYRNV